MGGWVGGRGKGRERRRGGACSFTCTCLVQARGSVQLIKMGEAITDLVLVWSPRHRRPTYTHHHQHPCPKAGPPAQALDVQNHVDTQAARSTR